MDFDQHIRVSLIMDFSNDGWGSLRQNMFFSVSVFVLHKSFRTLGREES